ncbi:MAG TPA: hypothetical protein VF720_00980 [Candidatus Eisenbacteria bacterium]
MARWLRPTARFGAIACAMLLFSFARMAPQAGAAPLVEFGEAWFYDAATGPAPNPPFPAQPTIVGRVMRFGGALEPLNARLGEVEYTFVQREMSYQAADQGGIPGAPGTVHQVYGGGRLEIYVDATPDANFASEASFGDGEIVLVARCDQMSFVYSSPSRTYSSPIYLNAGLVLTGGTEMSRLAETPGTLRLSQVARVIMEPTALDPERTVLGYRGRLDGAIELRAETPVAPTTWSGIKALVE